MEDGVLGVRSSVPAPHTESGFEMPLGWVSGCVAWFVGFWAALWFCVGQKRVMEGRG